MKITMAHGSGGRETEQLIRQVFAARYDNEFLSEMGDAAAVPGAERLAVTTDSFVVTPLTFPGGDIGKLAVCGTVNDLLMRGAVPKYLTAAFVIEAGTETDAVEQAAASMAETAAEAGVFIVAGDTKVVENAHPDGGLIINTTGVGFLQRGVEISPARISPGDRILLSGTLGCHHAAILSARMKLENRIRSDVCLLTEPVSILLGAKIGVHAMRDVTRGGLATILNEFAEQAQVSIAMEEDRIPVDPQVHDLCGILGLDPLTMGNEGKFVAAVSAEDAEQALKFMRGTSVGREAAIIGTVEKRGEAAVTLTTTIGGTRVVLPLIGEGLPRIC